MKLTRMMIENGNIPPWYMGYAWYDRYRNYTVILPIPINLAAQLLRGLYLKLRHPSYTKLDIYMSNRLTEKFQEGLTHGIAIGRSQIYEEIRAELKRNEYSGKADDK